MITNMLRRWRLLCVVLSTVIAGSYSAAQSGTTSTADPSAAAEKATRLAESGHCPEALPTLRKSVTQVKDKDLRLKVSVDGVRCAMTLHQTDAALVFLSVIQREFPDDPDALYVAVHAYSELSTVTSRELARIAPSSYQAHELLAESYESEGKWAAAEKEYRGIAAQNPKVPGIHFRIGRLILAGSNLPPSAVEEARREFAEELTIDPSNASAEYVLGELARQDRSLDDAIVHFSKAAKLDPQFSEAFLGLGICYMAQKRYADAVPPLETTAKLDPSNANAHYQLGLAYTRTGREEDGEKEFAIHQKLLGTQGGEHPAPPDGQQ